ncbi:MAG: glycosyltransferase family 1 protein [Chloroflexia bacterium]|nr:glycosyltransferase family 1 protein [Chloroflexia bacterium]
MLITTNAGAGHWHPLVPVAQALRASGHEVAFATSPLGCAALTALGFPCFPVGADETAEEAQSRREQAAALPGTESAAWNWVNLFARSWAARRLPDLVAICEEWEPAVLVREDMEFAGCIAAERYDVPHATIQVTAWRPWLRPHVAGVLNDLRETVGLPPDPKLAMLDRYLVVVTAPPSYCDPAFPLPETAHAVRHVAFDRSGDEALPAWMATLSDRPIVYATMGTAFNRVGEILSTVLEGLRDEPISLIVTTGRDQDPANFGPQPRHVQVERYVPQSLLFPHCDAVIIHGGSGTVLTALEHGLPMVIIPVSADQPDNARRCEHLGIAHLIAPKERTPKDIRDAVRAVLRDPSYRRNAERLREEMHVLPGPERVVGWLEQLASEHQPLLATL